MGANLKYMGNIKCQTLGGPSVFITQIQVG